MHYENNNIIYIIQKDVADSLIIFKLTLNINKKIYIISDFEETYNLMPDDNIIKMYKELFDVEIRDKISYNNFIDVLFHSHNIIIKKFLDNFRQSFKFTIDVINPTSLNNFPFILHYQLVNSIRQVRIIPQNDRPYEISHIDFNTTSNRYIKDKVDYLNSLPSSYQTKEFFLISKFKYVSIETNLIVDFIVGSFNILIKIDNLLNYAINNWSEDQLTLAINTFCFTLSTFEIPYHFVNDYSIHIDGGTFKTYNFLKFLSFFELFTQKNNQLSPGDKIKYNKNIYNVDKIIYRKFNSNNLLYLNESNTNLKIIVKQNDTFPIKKNKKKNKVVKQTTKPQNIEGETQNIGGIAYYFIE